ncbi:hypothetical protein QAD02_003638 [Eretmocerus hayati]|uniref:Uncharacterized protein n=1 Tax=Eretmocerus hayati TaxID=131215 RepID=A0ACC2NPY8_9HYME|nr:hypothetical protein QAD02_003638 [Eretmocerus hayati]
MSYTSNIGEIKKVLQELLNIFAWIHGPTEISDQYTAQLISFMESCCKSDDDRYELIGLFYSKAEKDSIHLFNATELTNRFHRNVLNTLLPSQGTLKSESEGTKWAFRLRNEMIKTYSTRL